MGDRAQETHSLGPAPIVRCRCVTGRALPPCVALETARAPSSGIISTPAAVTVFNSCIASGVHALIQIVALGSPGQRVVQSWSCAERGRPYDVVAGDKMLKMEGSARSCAARGGGFILDAH
jgi:hypothetical protein